MSSKMVCFHLTAYKPIIYLHLICVGIPVAWAIMDKEDVPTLEAFFKCVNERVPQATINTVMTDDGTTKSIRHTYCALTTIHLFLDPAILVAFQSVYANTKHLCRWHIER